MLLFFFLVVKFVYCQDVIQSGSHNFTVIEKKWFLLQKSNLSLLNLLSSIELTVQSTEHSKFTFTTEKQLNSSWCNEASVWSKVLCENKKETVSKVVLSPFEDHKFRISFGDINQHEINVNTALRSVEKYHVGLLLAGCFLLFNAKYLSRSVVFHYSSGMTLGILMSWMIVLILLYRVLPFRRFMTAVLVAGTTGGFYFMSTVTNQIMHVATQYPKELATVTVIFGVMCMVLIYYFGPPTNERSLNLLQWFLQASAVYIIYQSSYCKEFTVSVILSLVIVQVVLPFVSVYSIIVRLGIKIIPRKLLIWYRQPKVRRLLTKREYEEEGIRETERALKELQEYCSSPKCNQWKYVSRLKDPKKFANFLSHGNQFTEEEIDFYDQFDEGNEEFLLLHDNRNNTDHRSLEENLIVGQQTRKEWLSDDEDSIISLDLSE